MSTVTVGCKLPNGLILELGSKGSDKYQRVEIAGANASKIVGGYGITEGVDEQFMSTWLKKHAWLPAVKNGMVFVQSDTAEATAQALDNAGNVSGFERLDPKKAPTGITPDPDHLKESLREAPRLIAGAGA